MTRVHERYNTYKDSFEGFEKTLKFVETTTFKRTYGGSTRNCRKKCFQFLKSPFRFS